MIDPTERIDLFTESMREMCAAADLPEFDRAVYEAAQEQLVFLWEHPEFCVVVTPRTSSIFGLTADDLRRIWHRKHGGDWKARLARGAIRRTKPARPAFDERRMRRRSS